MNNVLFKVGDNVLVPQTADEKDNPTIKAVIIELKEFELIVQIDNFTLPVPKSYCKPVLETQTLTLN